MAITINKGGGGGFSLYTGVLNMNVVAVNPTLEELKAIGYNYKEEPDYTLLDNSGMLEGHKIDFYLEAKLKDGKKVQAVHTVFTRDSVIESIYIDEFGRFATDQSKLNGNNTWHPMQGEIDLVGFMESLCNVHKDDPNYLETMEKIVKEGDVSELRGYVEEAKGNLVKVLLGVRKNKYQTVFNKHIMRSWSDDLEYLWKRYVGNEKYLKDVYYGNINMKTFTPSDFAFQEYFPEEQPEQASQSMGGRPSSGAATADKVAEETAQSMSSDDDPDDLPF